MIEKITPIRILLADDDEDDRLFFTEACDEIQMSTSLTTCADGQELMNYLHACEQLPDILFLDLNMPLKSGMECLTEIRQSPKLKNIRISIYSTSNTEKDINSAFVKGADRYIVKPSSYSELQIVLKKALEINWEKHTRDRSTFVLRP